MHDNRHSKRADVIYQVLKLDLRNFRSKGKGKLEEIPSKSNSNYHAGTTQQLRNSPVESAHVSTRMYCTLLPPNTLLVSLLSVFVEILFCKAEGQGSFR